MKNILSNTRILVTSLLITSSLVTLALAPCFSQTKDHYARTIEPANNEEATIEEAIQDDAKREHYNGRHLVSIYPTGENEFIMIYRPGKRGLRYLARTIAAIEGVIEQDADYQKTVERRELVTVCPTYDGRVIMVYRSATPSR